jgi:nucleoside-diphosphate-sugar epimerase
MILVTGATGRIGNVLVRELNKRIGKVKVFLREISSKKFLEGCNCEYVYGDILDLPSIEKSLENVEAVFHLAGYINISGYEKKLTFTTNIQGTKNIADMCLKHNIPLIYTSSIHAIFPPEDGSLVTESTPLSTNLEKSRGIYDYSKACATQYVLELQKKD